MRTLSSHKESREGGSEDGGIEGGGVEGGREECAGGSGQACYKGV